MWYHLSKEKKSEINKSEIMPYPHRVQEWIVHAPGDDSSKVSILSA